MLVLVLAAYTTTRALESGKTRWLALTGALLGFGFLTKMLQAFLATWWRARPGSGGGYGSCGWAARRCSWPRAGGWRSSC